MTKPEISKDDVVFLRYLAAQFLPETKARLNGIADFLDQLFSKEVQEVQEKIETWLSEEVDEKLNEELIHGDGNGL